MSATVAQPLTVSDAGSKRKSLSPSKRRSSAEASPLIAEGFTTKAYMKNAKVSDQVYLRNIANHYHLSYYDRFNLLQRLVRSQSVLQNQLTSASSTIEETFQLPWNTTQKETKSHGR